MRTVLISFAISGLLAGCGAPKPPQPDGAYRPINQLSTKPKVTERQATFKYQGDLSGALQEMQRSFPKLDIAETRGTPVAVEVSLLVNKGTLEDALRVLGRQTDGKAEVIWQRNSETDRTVAFIQYKDQPAASSPLSVNH